MEPVGAFSSPLLPLGTNPETLGAVLRSEDPNYRYHVASEFESMFLSFLLKEMRKTLQPEGLFGKDTGDVYGSLFDFFLGRHLAQAGGLGIGKFIIDSLEASQTR